MGVGSKRGMGEGARTATEIFQRMKGRNRQGSRPRKIWWIYSQRIYLPPPMLHCLIYRITVTSTLAVAVPPGPVAVMT
jgi:hypothetical protein